MTREALAARSVASLRQEAAALSIRGRSRMRKAELIEAILAASQPAVDLADEVTEVEGDGPARLDDVLTDAPLADTEVIERDEAPLDELLAGGPEGLDGASRGATGDRDSSGGGAAEAAVSAGARSAAAAEGIEADSAEGIEADSAEGIEADSAEGIEADSGQRGEAGAALPAGGEPATSELFIDRGEPIPAAYPGERMRVLIRDPGSLYVYWESERAGGWQVTAEDEDTVLHGFHTDDAHTGGYLHAPAARVRRVRISPSRGPARFVAELRAAPAQAGHRPAASESISPSPAVAAPAAPAQWARFTPPEEEPSPRPAPPLAPPALAAERLGSAEVSRAGASSAELPSSHSPVRR